LGPRSSETFSYDEARQLGLIGIGIGIGIDVEDIRRSTET